MAYLLAYKGRGDEDTKSFLSRFDVKTLLKKLEFGDAQFLNILLTNHPELLNEKDEQVNLRLFFPRSLCFWIG